MSNSYAQQITFDNPNSNTPITATIWLIVDLAERPDLAERLYRGTLNMVRCPDTNEALGEPDLPLLIYRPRMMPALLFSPAQNESAADNERHAATLCNRLKGSLGNRWHDSWLSEVLPGVPRALLPVALSRNMDPHQLRRIAAMETLSERVLDSLSQLAAPSDVAGYLQQPSTTTQVIDILADEYAPFYMTTAMYGESATTAEIIEEADFTDFEMPSANLTETVEAEAVEIENDEAFQDVIEAESIVEAANDIDATLDDLATGYAVEDHDPIEAEITTESPLEAEIEVEIIEFTGETEQEIEAEIIEFSGEAEPEMLAVEEAEPEPMPTFIETVSELIESLNHIDYADAAYDNADRPFESPQITGEALDALGEVEAVG